MTLSEQDRSIAWLSKGGLRPTRQRLALAGLLVGDGMNRHVTAEGLFAAAETAGDKLPSGKLAQKLGLKTAQLLDRATEQGYLLLSGDKHDVTPKGEKAGVEFVAKGRFGPYFLWPQDFHPV